jgi:hypothetical protein
MITTTIESVTEALIASLVAEGAAGAAWGNRVYLSTASSVVELSGDTAGDPVAKTWPCLMLAGPEIEENKARRAQKAKERVAEDNTAGTANVRAWPRFYAVRFTVTFETRVGYTGSGISATRQVLRAIDRFQAWQERTPKIQDRHLFCPAALSAGTNGRITPADIRSATGRLEIRDVPVYSDSVTTQPTAKEIVVGADLDPLAD